MFYLRKYWFDQRFLNAAGTHRWEVNVPCMLSNSEPYGVAYVRHSASGCEIAGTHKEVELADALA